MVIFKLRRKISGSGNGIIIINMKQYIIFSRKILSQCSYIAINKLTLRNYILSSLQSINPRPFPGILYSAMLSESLNNNEHTGVLGRQNRTDVLRSEHERSQPVLLAEILLSLFFVIVIIIFIIILYDLQTLLYNSHSYLAHR